MAKDERLETKPVSAKDEKKKKRRQAPREKRSLKDSLKAIRLEMKKVVWPTKKELGSYTVIVLITCTFFAVCFWALDTGMLAGLQAMLDINM